MAPSDLVETLLASCLGAPPDARRAELDRACSANPAHAAELRERFDALVAAGFIDPQGLGSADDHPERLGEFRLRRRLGGGGMGVVYLAEQTSLGREVALKIIRPDALYFPGARERFQREVETIARLEHPNIVKVHAVGDQDGLPYFAMEKVEGCTLAEPVAALAGRDIATLTGADLLAVLQAQRHSSDGETEPVSGGTDALPPLFTGSWTEACLRITAQVALALAHAHARGVIHRDIKPSNIMLTEDGRAMLLDFGVASREDAMKLTQSGSAIGSVPYMSPEQLRTQPLDERTDVYSLGVTLYELLTLELPYEGEDTARTRQLILEARPRALRARNRRVSWDGETVCATAMAPEPGRRYASAAAFASDLERVLSFEPIAAQRPGRWLRLRRYVQRSPARAALIGVLLLAVPTIAALGLVLLSQRDEVAAAEQLRHENEIQSIFETGYLALQDGDSTGAKAALERGLALDPDRPEVLAALVGTYLRNRDEEAAVRALDAFPVLGEHYPVLALLRAEAIDALGDPERAREIAMGADGVPDSGLAWFVRGIRDAARGSRGFEGAYDAALDMFGRAIDASRAPQMIYFLQRMEVAALIADEQQIRRAIEPAVVLWPDSVVMRSCAGLALLDVDTEACTQHLEIALQRDAGHPRTLTTLAIALSKLGRGAEALDCLDRAKPRHTDELLWRLIRVETLRVLERDDEARVDLAAAAEHADTAMAWGTIAKQYESLGDLSAARDAQARALEADAEILDSHVELARIEILLGQPETAVTILQAAVERFAGESQAHEWLAAALQRSNRLNEAIAPARRAVELTPTHVERHERLVRILAQTGAAGRLRAELVRWARANARDADAWHELARFYVDPRNPTGVRDPAAGLIAAKRAVALSNGGDPAMLGTLAEAQFASGHAATAVATAQRALGVLDSQEQPNEQVRQVLQGASDRYQSGR